MAFFAVWLNLIYLATSSLEAVGGFESRNVVSRDNECGVLADVAGGLLGSLFDDK